MKKNDIFFWNREYEGEFPDFIGQKNYLHFKIFRNNEFEMYIESVKKLDYAYSITEKNGKWTG